MDDLALVNMAVTAGEIMLVSGADVYRIEDTLSRMLKTSGREHAEVFVMPTGIFVTLSDPHEQAITVLKRVGKRSSNLNRICRVNQLSRRFCSKELTLSQAEQELQEISFQIQYRPMIRCFGYILTSAFFAILFGGGLLDCLAAGLTGLVLGFAAFGAARLKFNDFCQNAVCGFAAAITALGLHSLLSLNMDAVMISAIMPLVPGVIFTSAIRDTLNGDYSSGISRMAEAVVVALAVASGVGAAMLMLRLSGGAL